MTLAEKARTAIRNPKRVPPYIRDQVVGKIISLKTRQQTRDLRGQFDALEDLRSNDEWLLVILDACRADIFREEAPPKLTKRTQTLRSEGRTTFDYVRECWPGQYPEVSYCSGAVPVNSENMDLSDEELHDLYQGYRPAEHLGDLREYWRSEWDESLGIAPPERIVDRSLSDGLADQTVVHLFQPHAPFIGEYKLLGHTNNKHARPAEGNPTDGPVWDRVQSGQITDEELEQAYRSNLRRALNSVWKLLREAPHENVAIMADHGEALGEYGFYSHPIDIDHPDVRRVPWVDVPDGFEPPESTEVELSDQSPDQDADVKDRLQDLGYVE